METKAYKLILTKSKFSEWEKEIKEGGKLYPDIRTKKALIIKSVDTYLKNYNKAIEERREEQAQTTPTFDMELLENIINKQTQELAQRIDNIETTTVHDGSPLRDYHSLRVKLKAVLEEPLTMTEIIEQTNMNHHIINDLLGLYPNDFHREFKGRNEVITLG
jgi:methyl coenzyme M reductase subunit C-like uncharacterized protein (methanogenesis marker protein 7)